MVNEAATRGFPRKRRRQGNHCNGRGLVQEIPMQESRRKMMLLSILVLCVTQTRALLCRPSPLRYDAIQRRVSSTIHPLLSAKDSTSDEYLGGDSDVNTGEDEYWEEDDADADEYVGRFISEAFNEEEPSSGSSPSSGDATSLDETKRMMEQQQQQIDLLMKMVQQGQKSGPPTTDRIRSDATKQTPAVPAPQKSVNVAPLKAMLFIDGTWLYYSFNTRQNSRDAIVPKFGKGWQNNYKIDWQALPKLICAEMEKQRNSKTSFKGSDRPLEVARVMVFTSAKKETDPNSIRMRMFREMADANYDVHMMETVGQGEKCVDIQLAVEMLHYATVPNAYDVAILLSGDKDFVPALVRTRQKGKQVCIASMRAGCNRVLYESPHIRDYDVVWLENCLDQLIVPISDDERSRRDRAGYASAFTMMRVVRDFVEAAPNHKWVSSRDIGNYLKSIEISDSNMLDELKQAHGGLRTFLMERACNLFEVKFPEAGALRGRGEFGFWVRVKEDSDETLLTEFKRTQFFTKEEKAFLEGYRKENIESEGAYPHTDLTAGYLGSARGDDTERTKENSGVDVLVELSSPAIDYSQLTVARLKEICREKGLPVSGKKDVLIERLEEDRKLECEVIEKQRIRKEPKEAPATRKRAAMGRTEFRHPASAQTGNIYSSTLPQLDASRYRNPLANSKVPVDPAVASHLEALVKEYLMASGGRSGSRDIGRYLAANGDSRNGSHSALTELKDAYGSLLSFLLSRENTFAVLDKQPGHGGDQGFPCSCS